MHESIRARKEAQLARARSQTSDVFTFIGLINDLQISFFGLRKSEAEST